VIATPRVPHRMTTTAIALTPAQIRQNVIEDAREYQDERIEELADEQGAAYLWTFMHAAMISHWATLFHKPISTMLTNFQSTPSITIPAVRNLDPPPVFPTASGLGTAAADEPELAYPTEDDDWEVQSVDDTPALPIPPPQHDGIHLEVLAHLHTLHVEPSPTPAPATHTLGPNREPMMPTDPVPSMPSSPRNSYRSIPWMWPLSRTYYFYLSRWAATRAWS